MHAPHKHKKAQVHIPALRDPHWDTRPVWLVGIDDTDNLESRGTGFRARDLARGLQEAGLARLRNVTRHQLFVSPEIPYTSHNSSACLEFNFSRERLNDVTAFCRDYLARESAEGSDAGLCIAEDALVPDAVVAFGRAAKHTVLTMPAGYATAAAAGFYLEGLTGTRQGIIGALSAVGLHHTRDDGRFLWMRGVRELQPGTYMLRDLRRETDIDAFESIAGDTVITDDAVISFTDWARPVFKGGRSVLLLEHVSDVESDHHWRVAAKEFIKRF